MTRDPLVYIDDILESISRIQKYTEDEDQSSFVENVEKQDAVIRRLEIIGEAVKKLPDQIRNKYDDIPWRRIAGLRDVLIHEYSGVQEKRVWNVIEDDLPDLQENILKIKKALDE